MHNLLLFSRTFGFLLLLTSASSFGAEPSWGRRGTSVLGCTFGAVHTNCKPISGPSITPDNGVVTGVYVRSLNFMDGPIVLANGFHFDLSHFGVTIPLVHKDVLRVPTHPTVSFANGSFNGQLVEADGGRWFVSIDKTQLVTLYPDTWRISFEVVIDWEVMTRFKTRFIGKPFVLRSGTAKRIFARSEDARLVEIESAYPGAPWRMFDLSSRAGESVWPSINGDYVEGTDVLAGDPVAVILGNATYVYARNTRDELAEWARADDGVWHVFNLSNRNGGNLIKGNPTVTTNRHVFVRSSANRLLQWVPGQFGYYSIYDISSASGNVTLEGDPILIETPGVLQVFARGSQNQLMNWYKQPNPAPWLAYNLGLATYARTLLDTTPSPIQIGSTVQVMAPDTSGRMLQWHKVPTESWKVYDLSTAQGESGVRNVSAVHADALYLFGQSFDNRLLVWHKKPETAWTVTDLYRRLGGVRINSPIANDFDKLTGIITLYAVDASSKQLLEFEKKPDPAAFVVRSITGG